MNETDRNQLINEIEVFYGHGMDEVPNRIIDFLKNRKHWCIQCKKWKADHTCEVGLPSGYIHVLPEEAVDELGLDEDIKPRFMPEKTRSDCENCVFWAMSNIDRPFARKFGHHPRCSEVPEKSRKLWKEIKTLRKEMNRIVHNFRSRKDFGREDLFNDMEKDKDIALQMLFIELWDSIVMSIKKVSANVIGEDFTKTQPTVICQLEEYLQKEEKHLVTSILSLADMDEIKSSLSEFADNGAFWGSEKPVPRLEQAQDKYTLVFGENRKVGMSYDEFIQVHDVMWGDKNVETYKSKQFTHSWEVLTDDLCKQYEGDHVELPFKAHLFTMRVQND